jgi:hypothetical protein
MARYAEGTTVSVEKSQGDIAGILRSHGVQRQAWASTPEGDTLTFELGDNRYLFRIPRPTWDDIRGRFVNTKTEAQKQVAVDAEWRRRWRAQVLLLKAKLEFADGETSTVVRELLPYALLEDGITTVEEAITHQNIPLLTTGR